MFGELPRDIQESIVSRLDVFDRARLRLASRRLPTAPERRLGVLARAIKQRSVSRATPAILAFIESVPATDPTYEILLSIVPQKEPPEDMAEQELCVFVRTAKPDNIAGFLRNPALADPNSLKEVLFNMMLYNPVLFDHVASHRLLDVEQGREYVVYCCCSIENTRAITKNIALSVDELQAMYAHCIDFMYTEPADYIYRLIKGT